MNDGYEEILVKRGKKPMDALLKGMTISAIVILVALGILFVQPLFMMIGVIFGLLAYYFILPNFDVEYEYLYISGDIDIDKIMARRKRKKVASYTKDNMEIMAPTGSDHLSSYLQNGKVKDFTSSNPDIKTWTLVYSSEKAQDIVELELTDEIAQDMRRYAPRKVFFE